MRPGLSLAALALLGACASAPPLEARLAPLVGKSELEMIAALGVPARSTEAGGLRFAQYEQRRQVVHQVDSFAYGRPYGRFGGLLPPSPVVLTRSCDITFTLKDGVVQGFVLRGDDCG